ncbi:hypothetical protein V6N11_025692 [Hibiscus sabdariffa]|uniref:Uncharacterized protein n=1 Tax=Hibiscus sabdariffa TaxID=183260 RepID=A0ABR2SU55_9ROSI
MHKLGFLLISDTDALWLSYYAKNIELLMLAPPQLLAPIVHLFGVRPLIRYLHDLDVAFSGLTFADVSNVDGNWDFLRLAALFDNSILAHILSVKCPSLDDGADRYSSCLVCRYPLETVLHALRDYDAVREIWLQILPEALLRPFFDCNLQ